MKGPELQIEFSSYYNDKKEKFDEGGLYPFLEYCQSSKPKDVVVRVDYEMGFDEIDVYCESLAISNLSYEKIDDSNFIVKFKCDSKSGKPIMRVIYALGKAGNGGHSYSFTVGKEKFYFDGDGADRIMKINGVKFMKIKNSYDLGKVWNETTKNKEENNDDMISVNESHGAKKHKGPKDTLAAMRKGNREADQEMFGGGFRQTKKVHKIKGDYDRKGNKVDINNLDRYDESVKISEKDIRFMVEECVKKIIKENNDFSVNWGDNIESLISQLQDKFSSVIASEEGEFGFETNPFKDLISHLKYYYEHDIFDNTCFSAIYKLLDNYDLTGDEEVMNILRQLKKYC